MTLGRAVLSHEPENKTENVFHANAPEIPGFLKLMTKPDSRMTTAHSQCGHGRIDAQLVTAVY